ncbi:MAG: hypothetical protein RBT11_11245 [Desulfobacterales bacterium]|nr:hypothetical protein [Desulfobacterales bacterium]
MNIFWGKMHLPYEIANTLPTMTVALKNITLFNYGWLLNMRSLGNEKRRLQMIFFSRWWTKNSFLD